jgi:hypothetical protein
MRSAQVDSLNGKSVLVKSRSDHHNPPTGIRGTIEVRPGSILNDPSVGTVCVQIALEFPQMFGAPAHHRTITLDEKEVDNLLMSATNGTYELTVDYPIDGDS